MNVAPKRMIWLLSIVLPGLLSVARSAAPAGQPVQFSRDILPILSQNCFQCHGPDEKARKAKLRLDTQDSARKVVVPGKSADSEVVRRISAEDPEEGMPLLKTGRKLIASWQVEQTLLMEGKLADARDPGDAVMEVLGDNRRLEDALQARVRSGWTATTS